MDYSRGYYGAIRPYFDLILERGLIFLRKHWSPDVKFVFWGFWVFVPKILIFVIIRPFKGI